MIQFTQIQTQGVEAAQSLFAQLTGEKPGTSFGGILEQSRQRLAGAAQPEKNRMTETDPKHNGGGSASGGKQKADNAEQETEASGEVQTRPQPAANENTSALFGLPAALLAMLTQEDAQTADGVEQSGTGTTFTAGTVGTAESMQSGKANACISEAATSMVQTAGNAGDEVQATTLPEAGEKAFDMSAFFADTTLEGPDTAERQPVAAALGKTRVDMQQMQTAEPKNADFREAVSAAVGTQSRQDMQTSGEDNSTMRAALYGKDTAPIAKTGAVQTSTPVNTTFRTEGESSTSAAGEKLQFVVPRDEKASSGSKNADDSGALAGSERLSAAWTPARPSAEGMTTEKALTTDRPVFEQIAQQVTETHTTDGDGEYVFDMKLFPEGLGKVEVRMVCEGASLTLTVTAHSGEAGKLLSGQVDALRSTLAENYQVSDLHIRTDTDAAVQTALAFSGGGQEAAGHSGGNALASQSDRISDTGTEKNDPEETVQRLDERILNTRV